MNYVYSNEFDSALRILEELNDPHTNNERLKAIIDDAVDKCRLPAMAVIAELSVHNANFDVASQIYMHILVRCKLPDLSDACFTDELSRLLSQVKQTDVKFSMRLSSYRTVFASCVTA